MIFADLEYDEDYSDIHTRIVDFIESQFGDVKSGLQGDSWVWIFAGDEKVSVDTFTAIHHQIKCDVRSSPLLEHVIETLSKEFCVRRRAEPELEPHEDVVDK